MSNHYNTECSEGILQFVPSQTYISLYRMSEIFVIHEGGAEDFKIQSHLKAWESDSSRENAWKETRWRLCINLQTIQLFSYK